MSPFSQNISIKIVTIEIEIWITPTTESTFR